MSESVQQCAANRSSWPVRSKPNQRYRPSVASHFTIDAIPQQAGLARQ